MTTSTQTTPTSGSNKTLWAAIVVLGLAVLAMGITLIRSQSHSSELPASALSSLVPFTANDANNPPKQGRASESSDAAHSERTSTSVSKEATAKTNHAHNATKVAANESTDSTYSATPQPVHTQTAEPGVARAPAHPICATCGTVQSVTPIEQDGTGSGVGVVAGGVLGAVVGNQVGAGNGKTLATVLGAVGGGFAGNAVEKKMKKTTRYAVVVRMDDGSTKHVTQSSQIAVGTHVTVKNGVISPD
jgi:outer membrane lipoprotein SlyB